MAGTCNVVQWMDDLSLDEETDYDVSRHGVCGDRVPDCHDHLPVPLRSGIIIRTRRG